MLKSTTRVGHLRAAFNYTNEDERVMRVQVARLCVLYDDLMLEFAGARAERIETLDHTSANSRRFYFVRRTLGTLSEIRGAFAKLNANKSFQNSQGWWDDKARKQWIDAVKFFERKHDF